MTWCDLFECMATLVAVSVLVFTVEVGFWILGGSA